MIREHNAWLFPLLNEMRDRPHAWLGCGRVRCLETYIAGYMKARRALNHPALSPQEEARWEAFDAWCRHEKLHVDVDSRGWCEIVETLDKSDDNVRTFFAFLDEFLRTRGEELQDFAGDE